MPFYRQVRALDGKNEKLPGVDDPAFPPLAQSAAGVIGGTSCSNLFGGAVIGRGLIF
jgi:hypothetical protein